MPGKSKAMRKAPSAIISKMVPPTKTPDSPARAAPIPSLQRLRAMPMSHVGPRAREVRAMHGAIGARRTAQLMRQGRSDDAMRVQPKLEVGPPGDRYEREADATAQRVMRMGGGACCSSCADGKECEVRPARVRRIGGAEAAPGTPVPSDLEARIQKMQRGGEPLSEQVRAKVEPRFGQNFSDVRIHRDAEAMKTAQALGAKAYTLGSHIAFNTGRYAPGTRSGDYLMAHELTHVVQQDASQLPLRRQADAGAADAGSADALDAAALGPAHGVTPFGMDAIAYRGLVFQADAQALRRFLEEYTIAHGTNATADLVADLEGSASSISADLSSMHGVTAEYDYYETLNTRLKNVIPILVDTHDDLVETRGAFLAEFEVQAKANARATLDDAEQLARTEAVRYGLSVEPLGKFPWFRVRMQTDTPATRGLQRAAGILRDRRRMIAKLERDQRAATRYERDPLDREGLVLIPDEPAYSLLGKQIRAERMSYANIRSALVSDYPILAAVSELGEDTEALTTLAETGASDESAQIIAFQIGERLTNIAKVRANLDDKSEVNIWRLPQLVMTTEVQFGVPTDRLKQRWVADQVENEKPGLLSSIALLVLNLLALALAPATGGVSLAVAAGVNVAVTAVEVQEYLMQKALTGTHFDRTRALSQEDPSLFWLAVSIVGSALDVAGATGSLVKTFHRLAPLAKAAEGAKVGKEAEEAAQALARAAGPELAPRVLAKLELARRGESTALELAGATKKEIEELRTAARLGEAEIVSELGRAAGDIKLTRSGLLFICSSPCTVLREKYAAELARQPKLNRALADLERRALDAATAAKRGATNAGELADTVKREAQALEANLRVIREGVGKEYASIGEAIGRKKGLAALYVARKIHGLRSSPIGQVVVVVRLKDGRWLATTNSSAPFDSLQKAVLGSIITPVENWGKELIHAEQNMERWFKTNGIRPGDLDTWGISWFQKKPGPCAACDNIVKRYGGHPMKTED